jgi:FKBP-type peptidyl-prolyl cis-trans isomerase
MTRFAHAALSVGCLFLTSGTFASESGSVGVDPTVNSVPGKGVEADRIAERFPNALPLGKKGLRYIVMKEGEGDAAEKKDTVTVHYRGTLWDGTQFDSSLDRGQPLRFRLGTGMVIPGWDEGIPGMRIGEKRMLIIPYALAYGERGRPRSIPRRATLIFEVELLAVD